MGQGLWFPPVLRIIAWRRDGAAKVKETQKPLYAVVLLQILRSCADCRKIKRHGAAGHNSPL